MKFTKIYILCFGLTLASGCTKDFEIINKNNNAPTQTNVGSLLPSVIFEPINSHMLVQTWLTDQVMQYVVRRNDNQLDAYDFSTGQIYYAGIWRTNYAAIRNSRDMIAAAETAKLNAYVAAGLIFNSYYAATASELWVDAPFTDAGLADGNINPSYSKQQDIYTAILKDLDRANTLLDANTTKFTLGGDVLFKGDVTKWKKLANSLRLRYLLRLSNKPEINAAAEIKKMIADPVTYPIITSNAEAGIYDFPGIAPNVSVISTQLPTSLTGVSPSVRMVALLQPSNDPRLDFFCVKPTDAANYPNHVGVTSGTTREVAQSTNGNADQRTSSLTKRFTADQGLLDYTIISYSEVQFILAEAAMKGWIAGEAKTFYDKGITANFDYWKITVPTGFLAQPTVAWNNTMERLMDQKWMAFYLNNTVESWGETKRTGLPKLTVGPAATIVTGGKFPTRVFYPTLEQSINANSYKAGVANIGGDIITAKHWYQN